MSGVKGIIGMHRFNICLVVVLLCCENTIRPRINQEVDLMPFWLYGKTRPYNESRPIFDGGELTDPNHV